MTVRGKLAELRSRGGTVPVDITNGAALDWMARVPILGIVGPNGAGKSLLAAVLAMRSLEAGRRVLSTVRLIDWRDPHQCPGGEACDDPDNHEVAGQVHPAAHEGYVPWTRWSQVSEMGRGWDAWADEITGVAGSRDSSALPSSAQNLLMQLRHSDAVLRYTAPALDRADLLLRIVTQGVVTCAGFRSVMDESSGLLWPQRRLFRWSLFDAQGLPPDPTWSQIQASGVVARTWFWGPHSDAFRAYDSLAPVGMVGRMTATGTCEVCEGTRRRHECTCADYRAERAKLKDSAPGAPPRRGAASSLGVVR